MARDHLFKPGQPRPEGAGRKPGSVNKRTAAIMEVGDRYQVAERMGQLAQITYNNLAVIQQKYGDTPEGRIAFANDIHAFNLAGKAFQMYHDLAEFRFAKLRRIDHVGDAPSITNVENKIVVELNIGGPRPPPPEDEPEPVVIDATANGSSTGNGHAHASSNGSNGNGHERLEDLLPDDEGEL